MNHSWAEAHLDRHHFLKVQCENKLEIKNKCDQEIYFELQIYPTKTSLGLPNLARLSL
jgi:hypothetical protein